MQAAQSLSDEYKNRPNLKVKNSLAGEVVRKKKSMVIEDVRTNEKYIHRDMAIKENLSLHQSFDEYFSSSVN